MSREYSIQLSINKLISKKKENGIIRVAGRHPGTTSRFEVARRCISRHSKCDLRRNHSESVVVAVVVAESRSAVPDAENWGAFKRGNCLDSVHLGRNVRGGGAFSGRLSAGPMD
jgi:hypothetical protein